MRPPLVALMVLGARTVTGCCPEDARIHLTATMTQADVCAANGRRIIVWVSEQNPNIDSVLEKAKPIGAKLVCLTLEEARQIRSGCFTLELPPGMCCSQGMAQFGAPFAGGIDIPSPEPERRCSCATTWTLMDAPP